MELSGSKPKFEMMDAQEEALSALKDARRAGDPSALINMATGLGKTYVAARDAADFLAGNPGSRVLYLCHQNDILRQARETFAEVLAPEVEHGYVFGGSWDDRKQVVYASFQTMNSPFAGGKLYQALDPKEFNYVIDDESHHAQADTYREVLDYLDPEFLLGLSATPDRRDGRDILEIFGTEVYRKTLEEGLAEGLLTPVVYKTYIDRLRAGSSELLDGLPDNISLKQLNRELFIPRRDEEIAEVLFDEISRHADPHAIIFCQSIAHAERMAGLLPDALAIHSGLDPDTQNSYKQAFKDGRLPVACVVDKFNEGINLPSVNIVGFLRSTSSQRIWLQQLGRGLRRAEGKDYVTVMDFAADLDRIDMILELQQKVSEVREREPQISELKPAIEFDFSEEARDAVELIRQVREKIERRKIELAPKPIEAITLSVKRDYVKWAQHPLFKDAITKYEVPLTTEDILYLLNIFESPDGKVDESSLRDAFQAQFRRKASIKEVNARLQELQELNLISPTASLAYGAPRRKSWRMNPEAVEAFSQIEPYKTRHEQAMARLRTELSYIYEEAEAHGFDGHYIELISADDENTRILGLRRDKPGVGPYAGTTIIGSDYHPGGKNMFESDVTQDELLKTQRHFNHLTSRGRLSEYEFSPHTSIYPDRVEPTWLIVEKLGPTFHNQIIRRMVPGEIDSFRKVLMYSRISETGSTKTKD